MNNPWEMDEEVEGGFAIGFKDEMEHALLCVQNMSKGELIKEVQEYYSLRLKTWQTPRYLTPNERDYLSTYLKLTQRYGKVYDQDETHQRSFIDEIDYLIEIAKNFALLVEVESQVMSCLAYDDPGAYAKLLTYRKRELRTSRYLGDYTFNYLPSIINNKSIVLQDHAQWLYTCESKQLESSQVRVSYKLGE